MLLSIEEAEQLLGMFGLVEFEIGLNTQDIELIKRIFDEYPALLLKLDDDGLPVYSFQGV